MDGQEEALQDGIAHGRDRSEVRDQDEGEGHRVDGQAQRLQPRACIDNEEHEHHGPGQEGRPVVKAHGREMAGLRPALGQGRGVQGEADQGGRHRPGGDEDPSPGEHLQGDVQGSDGVEDEDQDEIDVRAHACSSGARPRGKKGHLSTWQCERCLRW